MNSEILIEEGIVVSVEGNIANIAVIRNEGCGECHAKIICKPASGQENIIKALDNLGVKPGMKVKFEIKGGALLGASFNLYLIPLILLIIGVLLGMSIFSDYAGKELYSFLFGIGLIVIYFLLLYGKSRNKIEHNNLPKVISIVEAK